MNIFQATYKVKFSVLSHATYTYLTAVIAIAQILIIEVAETTAQAGYDRADWFYGVWATAHYSEMPETQPVDEVEPDYWFEPLEIVTLQSQPLHRFIPAPTAFVPFGLLAPVPQVATASTKRSQKPTQAPKSPKGRKSAGIAPRKAPTTVRSSTGALIPID